MAWCLRPPPPERRAPPPPLAMEPGVTPKPILGVTPALTQGEPLHGKIARTQVQARRPDVGDSK